MQSIFGLKGDTYIDNVNCAADCLMLTSSLFLILLPSLPDTTFRHGKKSEVKGKTKIKPGVITSNVYCKARMKNTHFNYSYNLINV